MLSCDSSCYLYTMLLLSKGPYSRVVLPNFKKMLIVAVNEDFQTRYVGSVSSRSALFAPKTKENDMFLLQKKKALLQKEKKSRETSYSLFMRTKREAVIQEYHLLYSGENYNLRKRV